MAFGNTPPQIMQIERLNPQQQAVVGSLNKIVGPTLQGLQQNKPQFGPIAQKAYTEFNQRTVPSIMQRLTNMGGAHSSALAGSLGEAGAGLQENLAAQEQQFNQQNYGQQLQFLNQLLSGGLQPTYENVYQPGQQGWGSQLLNAGISAIPAITRLAGGPLGGAIGSAASAGLGALTSLFQRPSSPYNIGQPQQGNYFPQLPQNIQQYAQGGFTPAGITAGATA